MTQNKQLFFVALLPPPPVQEVANQIKQHFATVYNSRAALKSPPHITLQPPFQWELEKLSLLKETLTNFAQNHSPVTIVLDGFSAFKPRVIYIKVLTTEELLAIQQNLLAELESSLGIKDKASKTRSFSPHITVAYRDLTKQNFRKAWPEFEQRSLSFQFQIAQLTLLMHNGKNWQIHTEFSLNNS